MTRFYFVEPVDSLFVRGNLAFGDAGEHGSGPMPPPPSLFAGAFRSAILGRHPEAMAQFVRQGVAGDARLDAALGTLNPKTGEVAKPGDFRVAWVTLAGHKTAQGVEAVTPVFALPADLLKLTDGFAPLKPLAAPSLVADGRKLPYVAVLHTQKQTKPEGGVYLSLTGWQSHLAGQPPDPATSAVKAGDLHTRDPRLGIGLNGGAGTVESGLIYTTEGHAFSPAADPAGANPPPRPFAATGFLVGLQGADGLLPETGFLRLGGDGRGARYQRLDYRPPKPPLDTIAANRRFRLILAMPGLFADGWLPPGVQHSDGHYLLRIAGCTARLVCAAVPRREIVSGWNLFTWHPKDAQRAAPAGSVYWFEDLQGPIDKLASWVTDGLWGENPDSQRRAEGFNLAWLAAWV
ncbi:type III-B CRISPR module-associated Cmr3 family protein [uncultured Thiodictyon sp.]|uniref:type III-B CRISPR module-associated Cmr3 family protein n=1 Tax=uncultured Thiodictyon sp. TaxID=1846217 RepID=UPI0025EC6EBB|nr:type III-B CRISPR module-associated Cmr3 family protein [uncultured Thiodictyon sp.]